MKPRNITDAKADSIKAMYEHYLAHDRLLIFGFLFVAIGIAVAAGWSIGLLISGSAGLLVGLLAYGAFAITWFRGYRIVPATRSVPRIPRLVKFGLLMICMVTPFVALSLVIMIAFGEHGFVAFLIAYTVALVAWCVPLSVHLRRFGIVRTEKEQEDWVERKRSKGRGLS